MKPSKWVLATMLLLAIGPADSRADTGDSENMALVGRWAGGPCRAADMVENIAYFSDGAFLQIYNFDNPASPVKLGRLLVPGPIWGVDVQGNYAYLADWEDGLRVIDVSDPSTPIEVGFLDTPGNALGIVVVGNLAYVADGYEGGLRIIDVSNPVEPVEIGFVDTPNEAYDVAVSGNYAYVADSFDGLRVIDVSDPTMPSEVGFFDTDDITYDVVVNGAYAYVADRFNGLLILDVSAPATPTLVGSLYTGYLVAVEMGDGYLYTSGQVFLGVVDVTDPTNPTQVGSHDPVGLLNGEIVYSGGHAYVADTFTGYRAIDVTDPTTPFEAGHVEGATNAYGVDVQGDYAYIASYVAGLRVIDISDPSAPEEVGYFRDGGAAKDVVVIGDYAYVANGYSGLKIIDVSNSAVPCEIGAEHLPISADAIAVSGDYAYLTGYQSSATGEVFVLDVSDPTAPSRSDSLDVAGTNPRGITVEGNYVYVAAYSEGLRIIDVSNPTAIVEVGAETSYLAIGVAVQGGHAYVGAGGNRMNIIDITNPAAPVVVGIAGMAGSAWGVAVNGNYAYVANADHGVRVFDVYDRTNPVQVGVYDTADHVRQLVLQDGLIIATDWQDGIWILEMDPALGIDVDMPTTGFALHPCAPNPFNPNTTIFYSIPRADQVDLAVYDLAGRHLRTLVSGYVNAGDHAIQWNGRDDAGNQVASGIYLYRLRTDDFVETRRMALVK